MMEKFDAIDFGTSTKQNEKSHGFGKFLVGATG